MFKYAVFCAFGLIAGVAQAADIEADKATLRGVDKITGRISTMDVQVGESVQFGKLTVLVNKCLTKPIEEAPENAAFLTITKQTGKEGVKPIFNGWMFSSNPALSAMEDPVYDIWVIGCAQNESETESLETVDVPVVMPESVVVMENLDDTPSLDTTLSDVSSDFVPLNESIQIEPLDI